CTRRRYFYGNYGWYFDVW
nr:immunoglobulin heavy chain junction region [Mus musculus]